MARPNFDQWLASAKPSELDTMIPSAGLHFFAPLSDDAATIAYKLNDQPRQAALPPSAEWREGKTKPKAVYLNQGAILEVPDAGDFEGDQPFSVAAWVKLPANDGSASILARMDDQNAFRGWDLWIEGRRVGAHIINKWPENALKAVTKDQLPADQWVHVAFVYDGSRKAAGLKVYVNGQLQPLNVAADSLTDTIRTQVPLKIGQRHTTSPLSGASIEDVRIYARTLADGETSSLASAALLASVQAAAPEARNPADVDSLFTWWLTNLDETAKDLVTKRDELTRERNDIQARSAVTHVMQERPIRPWPMC
jgi:hypothetical protein